MFRLIVLSSLMACAFGGPFRGQNLRLDGSTSDIDISEVPHQVSVEKYGRHLCGGAIISKTFVVTGGSCTHLGDDSALAVRAGTSTVGSGGVVIKVAKVYEHPDFSWDYAEYDISVLELAEPVEFNDNIQPIPFNSQEPAVGSDAVVSGWAGVDGGDRSHLRAVTVPIISKEECKKAFESDYITDRMICAGIPEEGKGPCDDSGGPLVVDGKLVGLVSWGIGCAYPGVPGVYSNVPNLSGFILGVTGPL